MILESLKVIISNDTRQVCSQYYTRIHEMNIIPTLVQLLDQKFYSQEKMVHETVWIFINILSINKYTREIFELKIVPKLIKLIHH